MCLLLYVSYLMSTLIKYVYRKFPKMLTSLLVLCFQNAAVDLITFTGFRKHPGPAN